MSLRDTRECLESQPQVSSRLLSTLSRLNYDPTQLFAVTSIYILLSTINAVYRIYIDLSSPVRYGGTDRAIVKQLLQLTLQAKANKETTLNQKPLCRVVSAF